MAERRILEKELKVSANTKGVLSWVAEYIVDKVHLRVDDTIGPTFELSFVAPPEGIVGDFVILKVVVADATFNQYTTVYMRSLREYEAASIPLFRRYRKPFGDFEMKIGAKDENERPYPMEYRGNPRHTPRLGDRVAVGVLAPYQLVPKKCKITLQFIELFGHIGPEEIQVE
jgi:hypothetical protein